jgi:hypothetical protein
VTRRKAYPDKYNFVAFVYGKHDNGVGEDLHYLPHGTSKVETIPFCTLFISDHNYYFTTFCAIPIVIHEI